MLTERDGINPDLIGEDGLRNDVANHVCVGKWNPSWATGNIPKGVQS
jgi:hypothetical protein